MTDAQVSDAEKARLLVEIGGEPSPAASGPAPAALPAPFSQGPAQAPAPAQAATSAAPARPPRALARIWPHRRLVAAVVMLTAGSAWIAMWMVSGRPAAAGLALLGIAGGAWVALRPKKY